MNKWRYANASVIGQAHINQETVCQDRLLCRTIETKSDGEVFVAVVADGAGSTSHGQIGAEIACETFIGQVADFLNSGNASVCSLNEDFGKFWIEFFQAQIKLIADEKKEEIRDFASTFIGAIVGENATVFYQVGDGGAVFSTDGKPESYHFGIEPSESEYVNTTEFLTDENAVESLAFCPHRRKNRRLDFILGRHFCGRS